MNPKAEHRYEQEQEDCVFKKKKKKAHCWWERVGFEWRSRWGWSNRQGQGTNAAKDCCMRSSENRELRTEKDKKGLRQMNAADREEQVLVNANTWVGNKLTETAWSGSCVYNVFTVKVLDLGIYCRAGWWQAAGSLTSPAHHILQSSRQKTETQKVGREKIALCSLVGMMVQVKGMTHKITLHSTAHVTL